MAARFYVLMFILVCLAVGALLVWLPWTPYWQNNFFLYYAVSKTGWTRLVPLFLSGYTRGAVTGIGVVNVLLGLREIFYFDRAVKLLEEQEQV